MRSQPADEKWQIIHNDASRIVAYRIQLDSCSTFVSISIEFSFSFLQTNHSELELQDVDDEVTDEVESSGITQVSRYHLDTGALK